MRHALEVALQDFEGALVLVSHDRHLLRAVTDELVLVRNGRVQAFTGDIESYERELTPDTQQSGSVSVSGSGRKEQRRQAAEERQRKQPVVDRLKRIEVLLERFATEQTRLDILLSNASMYEPANKAKLEGSLFERARAAQRIEELENEQLDALVKIREKLRFNSENPSLILTTSRQIAPGTEVEISGKAGEDKQRLQLMGFIRFNSLNYMYINLQ